MPEYRTECNKREFDVEAHNFAQNFGLQNFQYHGVENYNEQWQWCKAIVAINAKAPYCLNHRLRPTIIFCFRETEIAFVDVGKRGFAYSNLLFFN